MQLCSDRFRLVRTGFLDGFEVLHHGRIGTSLDHVGHTLGAFVVTAGELARFIVAIPVETFR